jgi:hypothetical protein
MLESDIEPLTLVLELAVLLPPVVQAAMTATIDDVVGEDRRPV